MRLQAALWFVTKRASDLGVLLVDHSKPGSAHSSQHGPLCLSISRDLLFHLDGLTSPNEVWENIFEIFGKIDEMRGHHIENEFISLSPNSFESLQLYFSKFKALVLQLKQCGIEKKEEQQVLAIISKLGPDYLVFFLTFHATKLIS